MKIDKDKIKYVVGIDIGHGETSAAYCAMQWDSDMAKLQNAEDIELNGGKTIPSIISISKDGTAKIGISALRPGGDESKDQIRVCFKKAPKNIDGEAEQLMITFMKEVYKLIMAQPIGLTPTNHLVYIATPSGWNSETQDLYKRMAEEAGLPMGGVTKESRAAFVRAQHDPTSNLGRNIEKGAIVFDMGSSTLDFTYMNHKLDKMIDFGYNCGASGVEKTLYSLESHSEEYGDLIKLFEAKYPELKDSLLFRFREIKEFAYSYPNEMMVRSINFDEVVLEDKEIDDKKIKFRFQPGQLNETLEKSGYINQIRKAMLDFKNNKIPGKPIYGVYMTGGASRMDFLIPLIMECWGISKNDILRDQEPSLTISQGVAEVARMDLMTNSLDNGLADAIKKLTSGDVVYESFVESFAPELSDYIIEKLAGVLVDFKDSYTDYSLNNLNSHIEDAMEECLEAADSNINNYVSEAFNQQTKEISEKVKAILEMYTSEGRETDVTIPTLDASSLSMSGFNMDSTIEEIAKTLQESSSGWGAAIAGGAVGLGVAMLLGGPLAWLIGGGAFLAHMIFGGEKSEAEKQAEAKAKALPKKAREEIVQKIADEKWDDIQEQIKRDVRKSLQNNSKARNDINKMVHNVMKDYKQALKSARILVE